MPKTEIIYLLGLLAKKDVDYRTLYKHDITPDEYLTVKSPQFMTRMAPSIRDGKATSHTLLFISISSGMELSIDSFETHTRTSNFVPIYMRVNKRSLSQVSDTDLCMATFY